MPSVPQHHARPIWAEISATRLGENYRVLQSAAAPRMDVLAVIKANAYGHGARECAPVLAAAGAGWLGVTSVEEGIAVRGALGILPQGMSPRLLVMCGFWPGEEAPCLQHGLTPVVWEPYHLDLLEAEARHRSMPSRSVAVHIEVETGMARQGVEPGPLLDRLLARFTRESPLLMEGVMTHLASSECATDPQNALQLRRFRQALEQVARAGLKPAWIHAGNTSSTDSGFLPGELPGLAEQFGGRAMTRAGLALYGHALPLEGASPHAAGKLQPVMAWKTRVVSLREAKAGTTVGYNATFVAPAAMRLALLPVGYADGFRRALSSSNQVAGGAVLVRGRRAPIAGRVSMDLSVVDVSGIAEAAIGDEVVLLGEQEGARVCAEEHARLAGTSVYEVLCGISDRVPRALVE